MFAYSNLSVVFHMAQHKAKSQPISMYRNFTQKMHSSYSPQKQSEISQILPHFVQSVFCWEKFTTVDTFSFQVLLRHFIVLCIQLFFSKKSYQKTLHHHCQRSKYSEVLSVTGGLSLQSCTKRQTWLCKHTSYWPNSTVMAVGCYCCRNQQCTGY